MYKQSLLKLITYIIYKYSMSLIDFVSYLTLLIIFLYNKNKREKN